MADEAGTGQAGQTPAAQGEGQSTEPKLGPIPYDRFQKENHRRAEAEAKLVEVEAHNRELEERLAKLEASVGKSDEPLSDDDRWLNEGVSRATRPLAEKLQGVEQALTQVQQFAQVSAQQVLRQQAEQALEAHFKQREGEGLKLDDDIRKSMKDIYLNQVVGTPFQDAVTFEDIEDKAIGYVNKQRMLGRMVQAAQQQDSAKEKPAPSPSDEVAAPRFAPVEPGSGQEQGESQNPWETIDTSKPGWQKQFFNTYGNLPAEGTATEEDLA